MEKKVEISPLSASEINEFIEHERPILRGKYKVGLVYRFKPKASIESERFGNKQLVLNLNGISLSGADLRGVILTGASMIKANLSGAELSHSDLIHVDFTGADLRNANFSKADLSNATFDSVSLEGTNFEGSNLFGAKFIKITGLTKEELAELQHRATAYVDLEREPLPDYYDFNNDEKPEE